MNKKNKYLYFLTLAVFKLTVGVALIAISWDVMSSAGNPLLSISLVTGLTFLPAAFARPLFDKFLYHSETKVLTTSFFICAAVAVSIPSLYSQHKIFLITALLIFWTLIFLIEVCSEKWLLGLISSDCDNSRKLSSLSMIVIQVSTISGPLVLKYFKDTHNILNSYYLIMTLCLLGAVLSFLSSISERDTRNDAYTPGDSSKKNASKLKLSLSLILALGMIWPAIAISNMVFPILGKLFYDNSFDTAANFQILLGLGMAGAGFIIPNFVFKVNEKTIATFCVVLTFISAIMFSLFSSNYIICSIAICFLGISFSILRIEIRALLGEKLDKYQASSVISKANALSAPFVLFFIICSYLEYEWSPLTEWINFTLPLTYILASGLLFLSIVKLSKGEHL